MLELTYIIFMILIIIWIIDFFKSDIGKAFLKIGGFFAILFFVGWIITKIIGFFH